MEDPSTARLIEQLERIGDALELQNVFAMFGHGLVNEDAAGNAARLLQASLTLATEAMKAQSKRRQFRKSMQ